MFIVTSHSTSDECNNILLGITSSNAGIYEILHNHSLLLNNVIDFIDNQINIAVYEISNANYDSLCTFYSNQDVQIRIQEQFEGLNFTPQNKTCIFMYYVYENDYKYDKYYHQINNIINQSLQLI